MHQSDCEWCQTRCKCLLRPSASQFSIHCSIKQTNDAFNSSICQFNHAEWDGSTGNITPRCSHIRKRCDVAIEWLLAKARTELSRQLLWRHLNWVGWKGSSWSIKLTCWTARQTLLWNNLHCALPAEPTRRSAIGVALLNPNDWRLHPIQFRVGWSFNPVLPAVVERARQHCDSQSARIAVWHF